MSSSSHRAARFQQSACYSRKRRFSAYRPPIIASLLILASFAFSCTGSPKGNNTNAASTMKSNGNGNANAESRAAGSHTDSINIKEPERYSVAMTISAQAAASEAPAPMLTQQFGFAKLGADRRWAFALPEPLGQVVYLEKSGLKYLVFLERKQYIELTPDALGFQLSSVLTPNALAEHLSSRAQYEQLGLEPVNGRTAIKYRLTDSGDPVTRTDGLIFVDQETGLPLRSELNAAAPAGTKSRVIVEARDVQLNPDRLLFDVPAGMKKVAPPEAKQQIEGFSSALRPFAEVMRGAPPRPAANATPPAANKNASRRSR